MKRYKAHSKTLLTILCMGLALLTSCAHTQRDNTISRSKQLASEGAEALNAKDYTRAQTAAAEATRLDPEFAEAWVGYGMASLRLGQTDRARAAYERALSLHQSRHRRNPSDANQVVQQIFLLSLLGRSSEAEGLLKSAREDYPNDRQLAKLAGDFTTVKQAWESWTVEVK